MILGETSSNSPFCSLQRTFSVRSPDMPKHAECIRQKLQGSVEVKASHVTPLTSSPRYGNLTSSAWDCLRPRGPRALHHEPLWWTSGADKQILEWWLTSRRTLTIIIHRPSPYWSSPSLPTDDMAEINVCISRGSSLWSKIVGVWTAGWCRSSQCQASFASQLTDGWEQLDVVFFWWTSCHFMVHFHTQTAPGEQRWQRRLVVKGVGFFFNLNNQFSLRFQLVHRQYGDFTQDGRTVEHNYLWKLILIKNILGICTKLSKKNILLIGTIYF